MTILSKLSSFLAPKHKKGMMAGIIMGVIAITIAIILIVNVIAPQLSLNAVQQGYLGTGGYAMWSIIALVIVAGLIFLVGRVFGLFGSGGLE